MEGFLIIFLGYFFDKQHTGTLCFVVAQCSTTVTGGKTPGLPGLLWISGTQIHKGDDTILFAYQIQSSLSTHPACAGSLRTGYPFRVVDAGTLRPSDDLYKSFCTISEDR